MMATSMDDCLDTHCDLVNALAAHYGAPLDQLLVESHIDTNGRALGTLNVVLVVAVSPADLQAAVERIKGAKT